MKTDIMALIVFFMMGFNLCIPVIQKQFEIDAIPVKADPLGDPPISWNWTIENDTVFINNSWAYLSASPHTLVDDGWVEFELESKQLNGSIDVGFGFNSTTAKPKKIEIWRNYTHNLTGRRWVEQYMNTMLWVTAGENLGMENYSNYDVDVGNENNTYLWNISYKFYEEMEDKWYNNSLIIAFESKTPLGMTPDINYTFFYYDEAWETYHYDSMFWDWKPFNFDYTVVDYSFRDADTWYLFRDIPIQEDVRYKIRGWIDIPFGGLEGSSGKYWWVMKPHGKTIGQSIADGHFLYLDPWWDTDWGYYKTIEVADKIDDYQMKILVDYDDDKGGNISCEGHCQADFDDIRFVYNNATELPYWIENYTADTQATFWVNNSGNYSSFEMFYGNAGVGNNSDGDATFVFFDDFEDNNLDKWDATGIWEVVSTNQQQGAYCAFNTGSSVTAERIMYKDITVTQDCMHHVWGRMENDDVTTPTVYLVSPRESGTVPCDSILLYLDTNKLRYKINGGLTDWAANEDYSDLTWFRAEVGYDFDGAKQQAWNDRAYMGEIDLKDRDGGDVANIIQTRVVGSGGTSTADMWLDVYYIRLWDRTNPPVWSSFGSEQSALGVNNDPTLTLSSIYPNVGYTSDTYFFNVTYTDIDDDSPGNITVNITNWENTWYSNNSMSWISGDNITGAVFSYNTNSLSVADYNFTICADDGNGSSDVKIIPILGAWSYTTLRNETFPITDGRYGEGVAVNGTHIFSSSLTDTGSPISFPGTLCRYDMTYTKEQEIELSNDTVRHISDCYYKDGYIYVADIYDFWTGYDNCHPYVSRYWANDTFVYVDTVLNESDAVPFCTEGITYYDGYWWLNSHFQTGEPWNDNYSTVRKYDANWNFIANYTTANGSAGDAMTQGLDFVEVENVTYLFVTHHTSANEGLQIYRWNGTAFTELYWYGNWGWANQGLQVNGSNTNIDSVWFMNRYVAIGPGAILEIDFDKASDIGIGPIVEAEPDTTPPTVVINFAGNLSDSGGPYWQPPGESTQLAGDWSDGYYTNDSRQSEGWMYINLTVEDSGGVPNVWLQWKNESTWTNYTYAFLNTTGGYFEFNTSGNISTAEGYNYSFNIVANDTASNSDWVGWNKTGLGGSYTRRYVQLNCTQVNISYTPFYAYSTTYDNALDTGKLDRLQQDQGPDGSYLDTGYLMKTLPSDTVTFRECASYAGYWYNGNESIVPFNLNNIYFHLWYNASKNPDIGWNKTREYLSATTTDSFDPTGLKYSEVYVSGSMSYHLYNLTTALLNISSTSFTDNNIYELAIKISKTAAQPAIVSNRSFTSFVLFNVPSNATINASHADTDSDGLSDWTELYVNYTNPFLADTDNDGVSDYDETLSGSDPNNYTNTIEYKVWVTLDTWNITIGNLSISPFIIDTWEITLSNTSSHAILEPSFETVTNWVYYENKSGCYGEQSGSGVTDGSKSYGLAVQSNVETGYCKVYQTHINLTDINNIYTDLYLNSDVSIDVPAYVSMRVNDDILYERRIGQTERISIHNVSIDVRSYGDYCTLEYRLNQTDVGIYDEGIFAYIDNIRTSIWHTLDTWNITLGNMSISPYVLDTWNITLSNTPQPYTLDTWNLTLSNTPSAYTLDTWNLTLSNLTISSHVLDTWNVTLGNMSITPYTLDTWNVTLGNMTISSHVLDTWNITLSNLTIYPYTLDTWNVTLSNTPQTHILDTWNVTLSNLTISSYILDTWNLTLSNLTISSYILDTWNLTLGNLSISPHILDTWNLTLGNLSISPYIIDRWNLTLSNTSFFFITNITATPSEAVIDSVPINITCNVTSLYAIVNVTVNMTGGVYDMISGSGDLYYYNVIGSGIGTHYYHIYANDTSGDQQESATYSFRIIGLSCSFTYTVKGGLMTLTPTITGATHYRWTFISETGVKGQTSWILIEDIGSYIQGYVYPTTIRATLSAKNIDFDQYANYSDVIRIYKSSFEKPTPTVDEPEPEPTNVFKEIADAVGKWFGERNGGELLFMAVMAVIAALFVVKKKYPQKKFIYQILKKKKKKEKEKTPHEILIERIDRLEENVFPKNK